MSSKATIVQRLMDEFGKDSQAARQQIEQAVGEITVDLLSQNQGRFLGLEKTLSITINNTDTEYRLPADFNTAKKTFYEVNSDGDYIAECMCLSKSEVQNRMSEGAYSGYRLAYIRRNILGASGRGDYLVIADAPDETKYFEFDYYREPTENDTDVIRNDHIVMTGARGLLPQFVDMDRAAYQTGIYSRMRDGFREHPEKRKTKRIMLPSKRIGNHNRRMYERSQRN